MLMAPGEADAEQDTAVAVAVEQFMQSATLGEYQRRLDLIWTFRWARLKADWCFSTTSL